MDEKKVGKELPVKRFEPCVETQGMSVVVQDGEDEKKFPLFFNGTAFVVGKEQS